MQFSRVVEVVLRAGGHVDACLLGKRPLIVSAEIRDNMTVRQLFD
jgi:hypothetical protein